MTDHQKPIAACILSRKYEYDVSRISLSLFINVNRKGIAVSHLSSSSFTYSLHTENAPHRQIRYHQVPLFVQATRTQVWTTLVSIDRSYSICRQSRNWSRYIDFPRIHFSISLCRMALSILVAPFLLLSRGRVRYFTIELGIGIYKSFF